LVRLRFALAASLPALGSLAAMALLADHLARRALEEALGARLVAVAQAAAASLPADRVAELLPGDEGTRTYANLQSRLEPLAQATATRLLVARPDRTALLDTRRDAPIGTPVPALERDRLELAEVIAGQARSSQVLFATPEGEIFKTGYAPLRAADGKVVAVVAADGSAPAFGALGRFRRLLATLAIAGAALGAAVAAAAALTVTRPLAGLARWAGRLGLGELSATTEGDAGRGGGPEVGALRRTLEEMRRALASRAEERETLLAGIAHEIRNPLGGLELFAGLLAEELKGRPEAAHVDRIRAEVGQLTRIVEEFLGYARTPALRIEAADAAAFASEVAELALPLAQERGVSIDARGSGAVAMDRERLRRAALNLVRNAVEASPSGGRVELEVGLQGGTAVVEVRDRGPGLAAGTQEQLFRPFFTTKEKGTGLGLALARKIAVAHGGAVDLAARDGGGTIARISLPAQRIG
jgi:signal transduction histidine kinase